LIQKPLHCVTIQRKMLGLPPQRCFPLNAEPGEVFKDRGLEFRPAAPGVDILDAQQQSPAALPRQIEILERRIGMSEMEQAVRARRKTKHRRH
jgi:hypothetical protein